MTNTNLLSLTIFLISTINALLLPPVYAAAAYNTTEMILLDCGATSNTISSDGRTWDADARSKYSSPSNQKDSSHPSIASIQAPSIVPETPYLSALIINTKYTFTFPLSPGSKFLRLYFYPQNYSNLDITTSFFSVTANNQFLMKNFSAHLTVSSIKPPTPYLIKEFITTVSENQVLNITFTPEMTSPNTFAFINGIEIVSMPSDLYARGKEITFIPNHGGSQYIVDNTTTLETMYRLDVGGNRAKFQDDSGMYRIWRNDDEYVQLIELWPVPSTVKTSWIGYTGETPPYIAPEEVYTSMRMMSNQSSINRRKNMTWILPVDAGFNYLVRLHFCELLIDVDHKLQGVFKIFINNQTAEKELDVFREAGGGGLPMYRDYVVNVIAENGIQGRNLLLELHPVDKFKLVNAFLNGLEVFKLNGSDGSLAGPNPDPISVPAPPISLPEGSRRKKSALICSIIGAIVGGFALILLVITFFICRRKRDLKNSASFASKHSTTKTSSTLPSDLCRHLSIAEIKAATQDFNELFVIGKGGFGNVYKGIIDGGTTTVAIKRLSSSSGQGAHEFNTEITMLSTLRHVHLVSLLGYCDDNREMILVYDFMRRGTLRDHLYKTENPPLSWKRRLEICIGTARGLHYLHREAKHCIIHRDVKSSNILLDENFVAKVSDFGLSKLGPTSTLQTHVSTMVKGSFGYLDPEYYLRQHLTEKSDVYSFGVVLFEVLCGRPPVIQGLPKEQVSLAHWARKCYLKGTLGQIVDPYMMGQISPMALQKFGEVAESCVRDQGTERPPMSDIVWGLEFTLELQEASDKNMDGGDAGKTDDEMFSGSSDNVAQSKTSNDSSTTISNLSYGAQNSLDSSRYNGVN